MKKLIASALALCMYPWLAMVFAYPWMKSMEPEGETRGLASAASLFFVGLLLSTCVSVAAYRAFDLRHSSGDKP